MSQPIPKTTKQWNLVDTKGFDSLVYSEKDIPEVGDSQVMVRIHGASVNYRDLIISQGGYPWPLKQNIVPGSDGAGIVLAIGKNVTRFQPGDEVVTIINQQHIAGSMNPRTLMSGLGASLDGTFRSIGLFDEQGLVAMPKGLSYIEAATLSCAGLTAWNALFGLPGKLVTAGQWVLTQGTGGVSIFAVQFAKAVGARVIATTSSDKKAELLRRLGADHIINYRETPSWGTVAKELTGGVGVDHVVEVTGPTSMDQSVACLRLDGTISIVGSVGGQGGTEPGLLNCWMGLFTARGVWVGNRLQMEEMCRAIEANLEKLRPVVDPKVFSLEEVKEAFEYQWAGKHQGKVCIKIE